MALVEGLVRKIWQEALDVQITNPIPQMTYRKAMKLFASDKPDLRVMEDANFQPSDLTSAFSTKEGPQVPPDIASIVLHEVVIR